MSIIITKNADGTTHEEWNKEEFIVTTWTLGFFDRVASDRVTREVEAYDNWTAIDVAVDNFICDIHEVTEPRRFWEVTNKADRDAARFEGNTYIPSVEHGKLVFADELLFNR